MNTETQSPSVESLRRRYAGLRPRRSTCRNEHWMCEACLTGRHHECEGCVCLVRFHQAEAALP